MISQPIIDLTNPEDVVKEIFDDDQWVKNKFSEYCAVEILEFGNVLAHSFAKFPLLDYLTQDDEQAAFVAGFAQGVFDDLLTSTKLLVTGKLMASGNLMRQAIEGMAVSLLCSSRNLILIPAKKKNRPSIEVEYWKLVKKDDKRVESYLAVKHLALNCDILNITRIGVEELVKARAGYNTYSHPGMMGIALRMSLGEVGPIFVGGSFDEAKLPVYKREIEARTELCRALPRLIDRLIDNLRGQE